jgi:hypothetical protein
MTISASVAAQRASRRFMLVRMTPARYVVDDLASQGGGVYGMTWTYPVARVERNGTALTADTAAPSVNDHYYWNETAGTLQVKTASAPSTSNVVVVFYYLFYTGGKAVVAPTTPTDSATTSRVWEPRLKNFPTLNESVDNVINGVLSIAGSSVALIDTDCAFKAYLTANDSFSLKDLDIWLCVDSITDIQKVYHGRVDKVNWSDFQVTVTFTDSFLKMASPAFWGDGIDECFFFRSSTSFPNIRAADSGLPCRLLLASRSKFNFTDAVNLGAGNIYPANIEPAVCLDYSFTLDGTHNRQWGLCRTLAAPKTMSYGSSLGLVQTLRDHDGDLHDRHAQPTDRGRVRTERRWGRRRGYRHALPGPVSVRHGLGGLPLGRDDARRNPRAPRPLMSDDLHRERGDPIRQHSLAGQGLHDDRDVDDGR